MFQSTMKQNNVLAHVNSYKRSKILHGFTLIELLVVISIIALLISVLLPALGAARSVARDAQCLSNQRQIGIATMFYVEDHQGIFMPHENGIHPDAGPGKWNTSNVNFRPMDMLIYGKYLPADTMVDYGGTAGNPYPASRVFACAQASWDFYPGSFANGASLVDYGYNYPGLGGYNLGTNDARPVPRIDEITRPSAMYMFMDSTRAADNNILTSTRGFYRVLHRGPTSAGSPHARHTGETIQNLHVDGHVDKQKVSNIAIPWNDIGTWDDDRWWGGRKPRW